MNENEQTGRAKGGIARADALTPERRQDIGRKAALKRWSTPVLRATHGSPDHPLVLGGVEIPCYVLEDGARVLSQRAVIAALGMKSGGRGVGADRLGAFLGGKGLSPFVSAELAATINTPIKFIPPHGGIPAFGYPATILADPCDVVLMARANNGLQKQQEHIAVQAEILVRSFARVGIIALVDEATGDQKDRAADSLARILEAFIAKELQPWVKTFPTDFYEQLFRLRGLDYQKDTPKRPQYFGVLTNDIVYRRLAPGVLEELKRVSKGDDGRPKHKLFQKLTQNVGYPKLREHLGSVVTLMKLSSKYSEFKTHLDRIHPPFGKTMPLQLEQMEDDGSGL